ncbi:MAG: DUF4340 domain-containing protein [Lentisphaerae bacterium]|nr:DUF4340 domain-containing protein [Lentisphaerota bacterium]
MKARNLILLVVVAAVLVGWAVWVLKPPAKLESNLLGTKVLPGLPINRVNKIVLVTTNTTLTLAKVKGAWAVANRFNYPAAFDKIAESLIQLGELKVGQVVTVDEKQRGAFNLLDPSSTSAGHKERSGTRLELRDENDGLLAWLLIGKPFMRGASAGGGMSAPWAFGDYPDGQYVLTANGRVFLVSHTLESLTPDAKNWLASEFVSESAAALQEISVTAPQREPIKLRRPKEGESFTLQGLSAEQGALDTAKVDQLSGALNFLRFDDIADPQLSPKETGLDQPVLFEAQTSGGRTYTIRVGNTLTNDALARYLQVAFAWKAPVESKAPDKEAAEKPEGQTNAVAAAKAGEQLAEETKELNDRLAPWIFIIKGYRLEPFLIKRADLVKKPEAPKPDAGLPAVDPVAKAGRQTTDTGGQMTETGK